jgi:hypothetical protein
MDDAANNADSIDTLKARARDAARRLGRLLEMANESDYRAVRREYEQAEAALREAQEKQGT